MSANIKIFCAFKAEAALLASNLGACRKLDSATWVSGNIEIKTWNGSGKAALLNFLKKVDVSSLVGQTVILFGCSGAVSSELEPGQIFNLSSVMHDGVKLDLTESCWLKNIMAITVDEPVLEKNGRQTIKNKLGSCLIDQESFHFAEFMSQHQAKFSVIRFVSDNPDCEFKIPFDNLLVKTFKREFKNLKTALIA